MKLRQLMALVVDRAERRLGGRLLGDVAHRQRLQRRVRDHHVHAGRKPATRCPAAASPRSPASRPSDLTGTVDGSSAKWGYDVVFNGNAARVDYVAELAADGTLKGNVLRNGSPSPITAVKQ